MTGLIERGAIALFRENDPLLRTGDSLRNWQAAPSYVRAQYLARSRAVTRVVQEFLWPHCATAWPAMIDAALDEKEPTP